MAATPLLPADPRPSVIDGQVRGTRCSVCGHAAARQHDRCERCLGRTEPAAFGPHGTVWASATVHLRVGDLTPPFLLAYVDLVDGPRVLAHISGDAEVPAGGAVRVIGDSGGNLLVEPVA